MRKFVLSFAFILLSLALSAKGGQGTYFITGKAFDNAGKVLANVKMLMTFGERTSEIVTDSAGNYRLVIPWGTGCMSGVDPAEYEAMIDRLNPKWIHLRYNGATLSIENRWQNYTNWNAPEPERTRFFDLHFE